MLSIRLSRVGSKKRPIYRVVVQEKSKDPWAKSVEIVGSYNPRTKPKTIKFNEERVKYWLSCGAQCTNVVHNLLVDQKIVDGQKRKATKGNPNNAVSDKEGSNGVKHNSENSGEAKSKDKKE